jgi:hypothetical protein
MVKDRTVRVRILEKYLPVDKKSTYFYYTQHCRIIILIQSITAALISHRYPLKACKNKNF